MSADGLLRRLLLLLFLLAAVQAAFDAAALPALSAVWFDRGGEALLYVETWRLMWAHVALAAALAAAFWALPERLVGRTLAARAGAPRRPDPRAAALRRWHWLGVVTLVALAALAQLVYDANRAAIPRLPVGRAGALVAAYGAFLAAWLLTHARRPRD